MKARFLLSLCLFLSTSMFINAADYSISNITLNPPSPATLALNQNLNIEFDYTKTNGNVRIWARPLKDGSLAPGYAAHGSPLYTSNVGHVEGYFTFAAAAEVDQIRIQIVRDGTNEVLAQYFIDVDYTFSDYTISNISIDPPSPAIVPLNERVNIEFDYTKPNGNVRIWARPMKDGSLAPGYGAHGSPLYTSNSGHVEGYFTFAAAAEVDQIRIQIVRDGTSELLFEHFIDVDYTFSDYTISNISIDPPSPAIVPLNERVNIEFDYTKPNGNVRIWARPMKDGSLAPGYGAHASPLYTSNTGHVEGYFTFAADAEVDQIRIQIVRDGTNEVLAQYFIDVDYTFAAYSITNINLDPDTPYNLIYNQNVNIEFNYVKPDGNVRIWARPMKDGNLAPGYAAHGSPLYTNNTGTAEGYFTFAAAAEVDQIRIRIVRDGSSTVLHEEFIDVSYRFRAYAINNIQFSIESPATLEYGERINVDFDYTKPSGDIHLFARPMWNGSLADGYFAHASPSYSNESGHVQGYFFFNSEAQIDQVRIQAIEEGTDVVLHEVFIDVNFAYSSTTAINKEENEKAIHIYPNPFDDFITIETDFENIFTYYIIDMLGNTVTKNQANTKQLTLPTNTLQSGIYILKIVSINGEYTSTIIKK